MISVIMSTYNETAGELHGSINSILKQSYQDMEFIIINDNPERDDLKEILKSYENSDARISVINFIKHPAVLGKAQAFRKLNGYRALVPAEDYDLWLRMVTGGFRIGCMGERLLKYRVRRTGISKSNQYRQYLTTGYVRHLYKERMKQGYDSFSEEHVKEYLLKHAAYDKKAADRYRDV